MNLRDALEAAFSIDVLVFVISIALYFEFPGNRLIFFLTGASILAGVFILTINYLRRSLNVKRHADRRYR